MPNTDTLEIPKINTRFPLPMQHALSLKIPNYIGAINVKSINTCNASPLIAHIYMISLKCTTTAKDFKPVYRLLYAALCKTQMYMLFSVWHQF